MIRISLLAAAAGMIVSASQALAQPSPAMPTPDFVKAAAAQTDAFEREEGRLAAARGSTGRVKDFGRMMVADHTKTTAALKAALRKAGLAAPPAGLSGEEQSNVATLRGLHGAAFDKAYIAQQIAAHQAALGVMQGYAAGGDNAVLKKAAADTVPIVRGHLQAAQQIAGGG